APHGRAPRTAPGAVPNPGNQKSEAPFRRPTETARGRGYASARGARTAGRQRVNAPLSNEEEVRALRPGLEAVRREVRRVFLGSSSAIDTLLIALLARGHVLVEGVPGVAKTTLAKAFAHALGSTLRRIQFTPDLLPADITGTYVLDPRTGTFSLRAGPIFANVVLADEINRAPAATQSALLAAMQERQVTIEGERLELPDPFLVVATQNPIDLEGTYALPDAQIDRFLVRIVMGYPEEGAEIAMLKAH